MSAVPYRTNSKVRIDLDGTADYPLLVRRPIGDVIRERHMRHSHFRFAQGWLPNPNGWAPLGLAFTILFNVLLKHIPLVRYSDRWEFACAAGIVGLASVPCISRSLTYEGVSIVYTMVLFALSIILPAWAGSDGFQYAQHPNHSTIVLILFSLTSALTVGQFITHVLKRKNAGYWDDQDWSEVYSVKKLTNYYAFTQLEPLLERMKTILARIEWLNADVRSTTARIEAFKVADTSDLSSALAVDALRLKKFNEQALRLVPLYETARKHQASLNSLIGTLTNVAEGHRTTPDLVGTLEGEESEKQLQVSMLGEYRKYITAVEKAEAVMLGAGTASVVVSTSGTVDDSNIDVHLPLQNKASA